MAVDRGHLVVELQGNVVQTMPLTAPVLTIGRLPDNGLVLAHPMVSRHHAELRLEAAGAVLTDLGSANGTVVDGETILPNQPRLLADGATVHIGPFVLTYRAAGAAAVASGSTPDEQESPRVAPPVVASVTPVLAPFAAAVQRPTFPATLPPGPVSRFLSDLPAIFQESDFLGRYLLLFESIWEPLEQRQDHMGMYVDPRTCPASFLAWLAGWLALALPAHWPETRRRRLLSEAMELYRWRGTPYGLTRLIELCTGLTPTITEAPDEPFVFRLRLTVPPGSDVTREFVESLVQAQKPAHAGYVLDVRP